MVACWVAEELQTLDLGDQRLNQRARVIVDTLASIAESQPDAAMNTAALKAHYRFMVNEKATPEAILEAHNQASIRRTTEYPRVILAQDTTVVDITKPECQVQGAGPLESTRKRGFLLHPLYALTDDGLPLGIVAQEIWTRPELPPQRTQAEKDKQRKQTVFEEKESQCWLAMLQSGEQIARAHPGTEYTVVGDSESDICELLVEVPDLPTNCHLVIRGCQDRVVLTPEGPVSLDAALARAPLQGTESLEISERISKIVGETRPRRKSRSARTAQISVRACRVTIRGPARPGGRLPDVAINVVEAIELDPPPGEEPIRWVLLTTLPITSIEESRRALSTYACRWNIELYFKTLKSGLKIEKLKYEALDRYLTAVSLLMIVAWRVEYLKGAARHDPAASCEKYFTADEWRPAYMVYTGGKMPPEEPPTIEDFMLMIAELGGWQRKKSQGPPGSMTIWRGLRKMEAYAEAFQVFQKTQETCGV